MKFDWPSTNQTISIKNDNIEQLVLSWASSPIVSATMMLMTLLQILHASAENFHKRGLIPGLTLIFSTFFFHPKIRPKNEGVVASRGAGGHNHPFPPHSHNNQMFFLFLILVSTFFSSLEGRGKFFCTAFYKLGSIILVASCPLNISNWNCNNVLST